MIAETQITNKISSNQRRKSTRPIKQIKGYKGALMQMHQLNFNNDSKVVYAWHHNPGPELNLC